MNFLKEIDIDIKTGIILLVIFVGTIILTRFTRWLIDKSFKSLSEKIKIDSTHYKFFKNMVTFTIWMISMAAIISSIPKLKTVALTLFASAGILVALVGFAAQQAFSNIISGIFLVIFKPFRVGDLVKVGGQDYGVVEDITIRHTVITNFENKRIIIPNSLVSSEVIINDSIDEVRICRWIELGISYDSDLDLAIELIQKVISAHPQNIDNRTEAQIEAGAPRVEVRLIAFGDSSMNLKAYAWTNDPFTAGRMHSDVNRAIKKEFDAHGIEIPFPHRTLLFKNGGDIQRFKENGQV